MPQQEPGPAAYLDSSLDPHARAIDLIGRLTLEEKLGMMSSRAKAVPRLGLPEFRWGSECIHGLAHSGVTTVFPQSLALAATFDTALMGRVATAISDEVRSKYNAMVAAGTPELGPGLVCWSPTINIYRDGRWGRGQETYGEDPFLTARMGLAFVLAMQGDDERHLKVGCALKHFAAHSGPEVVRHEIDVRVSPKDLYETYLPHFAACFSEGRAVAVMGAYNRLNGEHCCASPTLLGKVLREQWGFDGFVLSDGGALDDLHGPHRMTNSPEESAALALRSGCDMCLGKTYDSLPQALQKGLIREQDLDTALERMLTVRFRLGVLDPPACVPWSRIGPEVVDCAEHRALARRAAADSVVLLKNAGGLLPLGRDLRSICVVGPHAADVEVLLGNYHGMSARMVTVLEGIAAKVGPMTRVTCWRGCDATSPDRRGMDWAVAKAGGSQVIVAVLGMNRETEGESQDAPFSDNLGDRRSFALPGAQQEFLERLAATGKPVVLVLTGCGPQDVAWAMQTPGVPAVLAMWYGGEEGGNGVADVLFGDVNPSGRLPITWPRSAEQLPPFEDYSMVGRTYRYMTAEPLLPFGYGLSYTNFAYGDLSVPATVRHGEDLVIAVTVTNTGPRTGTEVVQAYVSDLEASVRVPLRQLAAFEKVTLDPGRSARVRMRIRSGPLAVIDENGRAVVEPGRFALTVGGSQGDDLSVRLMNRRVLSGEFQLAGP